MNIVDIVHIISRQQRQVIFEAIYIFLGEVTNIQIFNMVCWFEIGGSKKDGKMIRNFGNHYIRFKFFVAIFCYNVVNQGCGILCTSSRLHDELEKSSREEHINIIFYSIRIILFESALIFDQCIISAYILLSICRISQAWAPLSLSGQYIQSWIILVYSFILSCSKISSLLPPAYATCILQIYFLSMPQLQ